MSASYFSAKLPVAAGIDGRRDVNGGRANSIEYRHSTALSNIGGAAPTTTEIGVVGAAPSSCQQVG